MIAYTQSVKSTHIRISDFYTSISMQCGIDDPHSGILDIYISLATQSGVVSKSLKANRGIVELEREVSGQRFST